MPNHTQKPGRGVFISPAAPNPPMDGDWTVYRIHSDGTRTLIESDLPEEIARQMVADYAAEGDTALEAVEE